MNWIHSWDNSSEGLHLETWQMERLAVRCMDVLQREGLRVEVTQDLAWARSVMVEMGKPYFSKPLDFRRVAFTNSNSFWLFAYQGDMPIWGAGVRVDDLAGETYKSYFERTSIATYGSYVDSPSSAIDLEGLRGRIAYLGDLFAAPTNGLSKKRQKLLKLFSFYCQHRCFADYRADVTYCFMREDSAFDRRAREAYGFLRSAPFLWTWEQSPFEGGTPEWITYLERRELPLLCRSIERLLVNEFAVDQQTL